MYEKTKAKKEDGKKTSILSKTNSKQSLNKNKETSSCNSCGVCNRLRNPHLSSEGISSALSYAKGVGKESCAVSFMQSNYGNRFTASVLSPTIQKKCSCGGSCPRCKGEEEADKISMSIMKMPSKEHLAYSPLRSIADSNKPYAMSYKPSANNDERALINEIMSNKGSGQTLDDNTRSYIEPKFGYDFSHVRVHTDSYAVRKSNELNAEAFAIGRDIFFNAGRYDLSSMEGKRLLAHELTHVVQQSHQPRLQRLVRTSLVTCPAGQNPYSADRRASTLLDNAITMIDSAIAERPANPTHANVVSVGNAMRTAFRLNPANNDNWALAAPHFGLPLIRRRIEIAKSYIDSVVFTVQCADGTPCVLPCGPCACAAGNAWSCPGGAPQIVLCPTFWGQDINQRARTWMHEVFHINFAFIVGHAAGQPRSTNAICYAQFVLLLNGLNVPAHLRC
jgi:hypothetical protein